MDVFALRDRLIRDYSSFVTSFINIRDRRIGDHVSEQLNRGALWPDPLIQLNPSFESGGYIDDLVGEGVLRSECSKIFRVAKDTIEGGRPLRLHRHQTEAIRAAKRGASYVLTTGTGSGKSLAYIVPIVDHVLRNDTGRGIQAIVVYPMNALANSQAGELAKFLQHGYPEGRPPVTFERYTGQEAREKRQQIWLNPPDILLTNYVMLELILTRPDELPLITAAQGLRFLVLDELHTYRGRQGADVALLVRRLRDRLAARQLQCIGTSATLAGEGTSQEQKATVARVASTLFGSPVSPEDVIGETLHRVTPELAVGTNQFRDALKARVRHAPEKAPSDFENLVRDPLAGWIESTFGLRREEGTGRLLRQAPRSVTGPGGGAAELSELTDTDPVICAREIQKTLLAGYGCKHPETGFPLFAFRLHQFIGRGDTVYASIEEERRRYITVQGQRFVPGDRDRALLPLAFCRECGQEYYTVWRRVGDDGSVHYASRDLRDRSGDEHESAGFIFINAERPWPADAGSEEVLKRVPEQWLEEHRGGVRVKQTARKYLPTPVQIDTLGEEVEHGTPACFIPAPLGFCLFCGVSYDSRRESDFGRLGTLSSEGRSTATTILSLSAIRQLENEETLEPTARKLLSFTDNRQDASLQAGHFNDFIEVALLRSALYRAVLNVGTVGLREDQLAPAVFESLNLPIEDYASDPTVRFDAKYQTDKALRDVLGYRIYRDLRRGWRITAPNLEECGLLQIEYSSLRELCEAEDVWEGRHATLATASPDTRQRVAGVLLDFLRRELAIRVDYLDREKQEAIFRRADQYLNDAWALEEMDRRLYAAVATPRPRRRDDNRSDLFVSPKGRFGRFLRRIDTFPEWRGEKIKAEDVQQILRDLFEALVDSGIVTKVRGPADSDDEAGYQLRAASFIWKAADGSSRFQDHIRVPNPPEGGARPNRFFVYFYTEVAHTLGRMEAREHTAQVPNDVRERRESDFREAKLPILFCSPTMELGVDIRELNAVNMRNVPPTPANYAQRSGRAGRSGQPALVFTYCTKGSPHDQFFFKRPDRMVAGAVSPPQIELANEDLIRAHLNAIWLAETRQSLGHSLGDVLDLHGDPPALTVLPSVSSSLSSRPAAERALARSNAALSDVLPVLSHAHWFDDGWVATCIRSAFADFDQGCERWRNLYRTAWRQIQLQTDIIRDASRSQQEKDQAKRLRAEAESQLTLLQDSDRDEGRSVLSSDFYSYRYFASEGFLPGYSFPRLPVSAFIPGRRRTRGRDDFISRPRFLAISEFGPRSFIYYEGGRYIINRVLLPLSDEGLALSHAKLCDACGHVNPVTDVAGGPDLCSACQTPLGSPTGPLLRLSNVTTKRRDRITCDEEERLRMGYELRIGIELPSREGCPAHREARVLAEGGEFAGLKYGHASTLWRFNLGWRRRQDRARLGFLLDTERGFWARNEVLEEESEGDPLGPSQQRVIPFVKDRKNALLVSFAEEMESSQLLSVMTAVKQGIQSLYHLEDSELAAEPLPTIDDPRVILFYEAAEGGAGVLRQLMDDADALRRVAAEALRICHFDQAGEADQCEAACYDCLLSYTNQTIHDKLDRRAAVDILRKLADCTVAASPAPKTRAQHLADLRKLCGSNLEREFLDFLEDRNLHLPSDGQKLIEECSTRPDFTYCRQLVAVYVDGPIHDFPDRADRDRTKQDCLENLGWTVLRFGHRDDWEAIARRFPSVFGVLRERPGPAAADSGPDLDLFPEVWHPIVSRIAAEDGVTVDGGGDVTEDGRVIGAYVMTVRSGDRAIKIVDRRVGGSDRLCKVLRRTDNAIGVAPDQEDEAVRMIHEALGEGDA